MKSERQHVLFPQYTVNSVCKRWKKKHYFNTENNTLRKKPVTEEVIRPQRSERMSDVLSQNIGQAKNWIFLHGKCTVFGYKTFDMKVLMQFNTLVGCEFVVHERISKSLVDTDLSFFCAQVEQLRGQIWAGRKKKRGRGVWKTWVVNLIYCPKNLTEVLEWDG